MTLLPQPLNLRRACGELPVVRLDGESETDIRLGIFVTTIKLRVVGKRAQLLE